MQDKMGNVCNRTINNQEKESFERLGWNKILNIVSEYHTQGKLLEGASIIEVDAILSKWVDIPRNQDELQRIEPWTRYILDSKTYLDIIKLKETLEQVRGMELSSGYSTEFEI